MIIGSKPFAEQLWVLTCQPGILRMTPQTRLSVRQLFKITNLRLCLVSVHQLLQTAQQWEEQGYIDAESMAVLPEDEETLSKVCVCLCGLGCVA